MGNKLIGKLCINDDTNNHYENDLHIHSRKSINDDDISNEGISLIYSINFIIILFIVLGWRDHDDNSSISSIDDDYDVSAIISDTDGNTNTFNAKGQSELFSSLQSPLSNRKSINRLMKTNINHNDNKNDDDDDNNNDDKNIDNSCNVQSINSDTSNAISKFVIQKNKTYIISRENVKVLSNVFQKVTGKRFSQFKTIA
jgi:hypothetical protein